MKNSKKRGFTIVELVIVIAVIAILAGVLIPTFVSVINKANESNDIQAARNMNTFLATAKVTDEVNSILDVYDLFDESGYSVENYKPLHKDRYYYYDKQYNQILYVDADNKVLFPTEHQGEIYSALGHDWMSLGMTAVKAEEPTGYSNASNTITATVSNAAEYAYVIENYNKASAGTALKLTIDGTIDMMGASCLIEASKGEITITGTNNAVIKNITSNKAVTKSTANASRKESNYCAAAIVADLYNKLTIKDVVFENLNVKNIYAGNVGALVASLHCYESYSGSLELNNVTIKNSAIVGHRHVGAVVGQSTGDVTMSGDVTLDNVKVMTVGGRSALFGAFSKGKKLIVNNGAKLFNNNSTLGIYESKVSEQKFVDGAPDTCPTGWNNAAWTGRHTIEGQTCYIYSVKNPAGNGVSVEYSVYGFRADAIFIRETANNAKEAFTTFDAFANK